MYFYLKVIANTLHLDKKDGLKENIVKGNIIDNYMHIKTQKTTKLLIPTKEIQFI